MSMLNAELKKKAIVLRKQGKTYQEISMTLSKTIPKGTLSGWVKGIELSVEAKTRLKARSSKHLKTARAAALLASKKKREDHLAVMRERNRWVTSAVRREETKKIALAMLYLGEGKKQGGSLSFGNSNPDIVKIFLGLLREAYTIDEKKFRATVQCRADQSVEELKRFWVEVTNIPASQFYHAQVDKRSFGRSTQKKNYKGVCRVDYFSAEVFNDLRIIAEMVTIAV